MEFEAEEDGVLRKVLMEAKITAPIGTPIAIIAEADEDLDEALAEAEAMRAKLEGGDEAEETPAPTRHPWRRHLHPLLLPPWLRHQRPCPLRLLLWQQLRREEESKPLLSHGKLHRLRVYPFRDSRDRDPADGS